MTHAATTSPPLPITPPAGGEGCPTPLSAREVLDRFEALSSPFPLAPEAESAGGIRVWGEGRPLWCFPAAHGLAESFVLSTWPLRDDRQSFLWNWPSGGGFDPAALAAAWSATVDSCRFDDQTESEGHDLIGEGIGGLVALEIARQFPERVRAVALIGTAGTERFTWLERGLISLGRVWPGSLRRIPFRSRFDQITHTPWLSPFDVQRWPLWCDLQAMVPTRELCRRLSAARRWLAGHQPADAIEVPVTVVTTEGQSPRQRAAGEELAAQLSRGRVEMLHSTGQLPAWTHPHRIAKLIRARLGDDLDCVESCQTGGSAETPHPIPRHA